jgi:glycosyltransferase involved in cell wall biosynthesis
MLVRELIKQRNPLIKSVWIELIEKKNLEGASAIHVTSELEAAELRRFHWHLPRVASIPNGIDEIECFAKGTVSADVRELTRDTPLVLFLGRISWKKGLDRLLKAFALTKSGRLAVVGPDDENMAVRLTQLAQDLQIADRVRLLPRMVMGADKEHLYASAQVFVLPSYSENFGNTVLEAMGRGIPVVVTPEVGAAAIVRESGAGLVTSGEPELLGAAIDRLIEDSNVARTMGQGGLLHAKMHYGWPSIAARMEDFYVSLTMDAPSHFC